MIIYDELKNDHDAVKEMMTRIVEMSSRASTSKVKLFEEKPGRKIILTPGTRNVCF